MGREDMFGQPGDIYQSVTALAPVRWYTDSLKSQGSGVGGLALMGCTTAIVIAEAIAKRAPRRAGLSVTVPSDGKGGGAGHIQCFTPAASRAIRAAGLGIRARRGLLRPCSPRTRRVPRRPDG
jgi:hypothetical protein